MCAREVTTHPRAVAAEVAEGRSSRAQTRRSRCRRYERRGRGKRPTLFRGKRRQVVEDGVAFHLDRNRHGHGRSRHQTRWRLEKTIERRAVPCEVGFTQGARVAEVRRGRLPSDDAAETRTLPGAHARHVADRAALHEDLPAHLDRLRVAPTPCGPGARRDDPRGTEQRQRCEHRDALEGCAGHVEAASANNLPWILALKSRSLVSGPPGACGFRTLVCGISRGDAIRSVEAGSSVGGVRGTRLANGPARR